MSDTQTRMSDEELLALEADFREKMDAALAAAELRNQAVGRIVAERGRGSQAEIADVLGCSPTRISQILSDLKRGH